jgi:hypothetical protein
MRNVALALPFVLALAGCAEVYTPRGPNVAVAIGSGAPKTYKNGRLHEDLEDAVRENPRALEEAQTASSQATAATVLGIVGTVGAATGGGLLGADAARTSENHEAFPSGTGIAGITALAVGLGFAIASGVLRQSSQTHYFNAVNMYNDDMLVRPPMPYGLPPVPYGAPVPAPGYRPLPSFPGPMPNAPPPSGPVPPPGFAPSPPPGAPGGAAPPTLPPGALPAPGTQPVPMNH